MARVTGIGGVFLRAGDPKALAAWYVQQLGVQLSDYGGVSFLRSDEVPAGTEMTAWSVFADDTPYFGPGPAGSDDPLPRGRSRRAAGTVRRGRRFD